MCSTTLPPMEPPPPILPPAPLSTNVATKGCNVLILSEAGKPIFVRYEEEGVDIAQVCGLIQAIRTMLLQGSRSTTSGKSNSFGDVRSIITKSNRCIVFMTVGSITLVAMSPAAASTNDKQPINEAYLKLLLEFIYSQILSDLTDQIQDMYQQSPNYDIAETLRTSSLHHVLDDVEKGTGAAATFLTSAVEVVSPLSHEWRQLCSACLQRVGVLVPNTIYALLVATGRGGESNAASHHRFGSSTSAAQATSAAASLRLVSLVQPDYEPHQLSSGDLRMLLSVVSHAGGGGIFRNSSEELWFPICLPRFNSTGFLYAYVQCLDPKLGRPSSTNLTLILLSTHNTTEQFQHFRQASDTLRSDLQLPVRKDTGALRIAEALENGTATPETSANTDVGERDINGIDHTNRASDVVWSRDDEGTSDSNSAADGRSPAQLEGNDIDGDDDDMASSSTISSLTTQSYPLLEELSVALQPTQQMRTLPQLHESLHYCFRLDCHVSGDRKKRARLRQLLNLPLPFPFVDDDGSKNRVWSFYQLLSLRLRMGAASPETIHNDFRGRQQKQAADEESDADDHGITKQCCPAMQCLEDSPAISGITCIVDGQELFMAMNGRDFELYMTFSRMTPWNVAGALGAKLARRLLADEKRLFLTKPLVFSATNS